jgi:hypothetical protein
MSRKDIVGVRMCHGFAIKPTTMNDGYFPGVTKGTFTPNRSTLDVAETVGNYLALPPDYGGVFYNATLEGPVRLASFPVILAACLGEPTTSHPGALAYKHQTDVDGEQAPSPIAVVGVRKDVTPVISELYYGMYGDSIEISADANGYLSYNMAGVAAFRDGAFAEPTLSRDTTARIPFFEIAAEIAINGGAYTAYKLASFSAAFKNNLGTDRFVLGSTNLTDIPQGNTDIDVKFKLMEGIPAEYVRAMLTDPARVALKLTATGALIEAGNYYGISIELSHLVYDAIPADIDASAILDSVDVTAKGYYSTADSRGARIIVTNLETGTKYVAPAGS